MTSANSDRDPRTFRHAAVPCCLQLTDVHECLGPSGHGNKSKALLGIEPLDSGFKRLRRLRCARPWIARPPFGRSVLRSVIVIVTTMFWLTIIFVAAHLMPVRIHDKKQKQFLVLWWTWSRACRRNAQYCSPPVLLRKHVRAPAPLPRHPERHMEQHHSQGNRPSVPLAGIAGERHACDHWRPRKLMSPTLAACCG
jgi:hypothetical protein